jgi:hypothetical protein
MGDVVSRWQAVILKLSDGRTVTYTGREQVTDDDFASGVGIVSAHVTGGQDLPDGCKFGPIGEAEAEKAA